MAYGYMLVCLVASFSRPPISQTLRLQRPAQSSAGADTDCHRPPAAAGAPALDCAWCQAVSPSSRAAAAAAAGPADCGAAAAAFAPASAFRP
eukprot:93167-Prymnesium_polylepis.1